jgi:general secretion pathway protein E/type IV pilus assembly protein PilB
VEAAADRKEVGDILLAQGRLTEKQLEQARRRQRRLNLPQHRAIVDLSYASEEATYRALAQLNHLEFVDLVQLNLARSVLDLVPVKILFHYRVVPVQLEEDQLVLAFCEPPRQLDLSNLRLLLPGKRLKQVLTTPSCVHAVFKQHFGLGAETVQRLRAEKTGAELDQDLVFDVKSGDDTVAVDSTIAGLVDQILVEALRLEASDVHIEPYVASIRLRYRIDGVLQTVPVPVELKALYPALVSRLKIMAGLNIAEKRLPQDGRISMKTGEEDYDLRLSTIPTKYGEAICLRVLGRQSLFLDLGQLGMEPEQESLMQTLTQLPQGFILLTGPTGSGKTTTLYAALAHANDEGRKIITIEDPIEYQLEGTTQIQVREEVGLTFADGLRSVLRHDPDVVLIGEIRDVETAETAVRAAQTGHLVFSTLHTNDSISAITRLLEMRIDPFLVASSLVCSIAQRLAQRVCRHCLADDHRVPPRLREEMAATLRIAPADVRACKGTGCVECNHKGYRGQIAIYEFFLMTEEIGDLLGPGVKTGQLRAAARDLGWRSLREQGWHKVQAGLIAIDEQQRLTLRVDPQALKTSAG